MACGSGSVPSVSAMIARSAPMASCSRSCSSQSAVPSDSSVTLPPCASLSWTAASTAFSSCGLSWKPSRRVSMSMPSSVRTRALPTIGTRLMQTRISISP